VPTTGTSPRCSCAQLELILAGEPPYDIYVRWKPLVKQAIGWEPDLNDGVRLNIRPFVTAGVLRGKVGVKWEKDRGTNPDGSERLNDLHPTRAEKEAARGGGDGVSTQTTAAAATGGESSTDETVLAALVRSLRGATAYNRNDQTPPAAVLWPDGDRQWQPLLPRLRAAMPELLTLGPYQSDAPETRTGPAIWLRCMIARTLPEADWSPDLTPVLYLPGVSKADLRAVESCPRPLQPLAELQYRGVLWTQTNGKDWTPRAFLMTAHGGLDVDVAADRPTTDALHHALTILADVPVAHLRRAAPVRAAYLRDLLHPDVIRTLLHWLDAPDATRAAMGTPGNDASWETFRAMCRADYGFDPVTDGPLSAATRLGTREGNWHTVWLRFTDAPAQYPHLPELLRRARPAHTLPLLDQPDTWPQVNTEREETLRAAAGPASRRPRCRTCDRDGTGSGARRATWVDMGRARSSAPRHRSRSPRPPRGPNDPAAVWQHGRATHGGVRRRRLANGRSGAWTPLQAFPPWTMHRPYAVPFTRFTRTGCGRVRKHSVRQCRLTPHRMWRRTPRLLSRNRASVCCSRTACATMWRDGSATP